jgi:AcrR family transcriptional regulator
VYTEYMPRDLSRVNPRARQEARRPYRMRQRRELVDRTRQRITEAAVRLHTSVGPSETSMSAVAEAAGVTRLTLYRHFPSKDELFGACMGHWRSLHPPPDPERWRAIPAFDARVRAALADVYRWYDQNGDDLYPIYRDAAHTPASNQRARQATNERMTDAVVGDLDVPGRARRRVRAAVGHVIGFWTWRSLVVDQGLSTREAAALATDFVLSGGGAS